MKDSIQFKSIKKKQNSHIHSQSSTSLSALRRKITLSNTQLVQCTKDNSKFYYILKELNEQGIERIDEEQYEEALLYLAEAERVLEYAASCGKSIDRALILTVLHNEACCYQRLYDLAKLSTYLQALLYNINFSLKKSENSCNMEKEMKDFKNAEANNIIGEYIKRKRQYGIYHLQYCALNSKNYEHQNAIKISCQAIEIMKEVCLLCYSFQKIKLKQAKSFIEEKVDIPLNKNILFQLGHLNTKLAPTSYEKYLQKVKKLLNTRYEDRSKLKFQSIFGDFSIGKIMQFSSLTIQEMETENTLEFQCSQASKINKALFMASGFFSIGTQLRLLSSQSQSKQENYKSSDEFLLSEVYHLYCLLIVLTYVPCETIFLNHLLTSYNNHYSVDLQLKNRKKSSIQELQKQIFQSSILQCREIIETLPEHSEIEVEGESKWSKSQIRKSPQLKKSITKVHYKKYEIKNSNISETKKNIQNEYISSIGHCEPQPSENADSRKEYEFGKRKKGHKKMKTENSLKGSSSLNSRRHQKKNKMNIFQKVSESKTIKEFLHDKLRRTKSKEKSVSKSKRLMEAKSQLKGKQQNKENTRKKSKQKASKEKKLTKIVSEENLLLTKRNMYILEKNAQKTLRKSKQKRSLELKKKGKKSK